MSMAKRPTWVWIAAPLALVFGLVTIKAGGSVLFFDGPARQAAGNYVPFVLWFNFLAGFVYLVAASGLWWLRRWAPPLAAVIALATLLVFAFMAIFIFTGGEYELRTVIAMLIRSTVWLGIAGLAYGLGLRAPA